MALFTRKKKNALLTLLQNKITQSSNATVLNDAEIKQLLTEYFTTAIKSPEQKSLKMQGEYLSLLRGSGLEFEELRLYQPGDDVRTIDWKTTARLNKPYVRINKKEQSSSILIFLDYSNSMHFGTKTRLKSSQAARLAVLLVAKALKKEIDITIAIYNGAKTYFYNKKANSKRIFELLGNINKSTSKINSIEPSNGFTESLAGLAVLSRSYENVYIMSDFKNFTRASLPAISSLASNGIIKLIKITDPVEYKLPNIGKINFYDINNNKYIKINTSSSKIRKELTEGMEYQDKAHKLIAEELGLKINHCSTVDNTLTFFLHAGMNA